MTESELRELFRKKHSDWHGTDFVDLYMDEDRFVEVVMELLK